MRADDSLREFRHFYLLPLSAFFHGFGNRGGVVVRKFATPAEPFPRLTEAFVLANPKEETSNPPPSPYLSAFTLTHNKTKREKVGVE